MWHSKRFWWVFEPRDLWVGVYITKVAGFSLCRQRTIYVLPLPMLGFAFTVEWRVQP